MKTHELRIALTADPELPVPPLLYGGIERVVDLLARGLEARGHSVTLFAHADSNSAGTLVPWPGKTSNSKLSTLRNTATLAQRVFRNEFDIIHSFSRIAYLAPLLRAAIPKVMTYQRAVTPQSVEWGHRLSGGSLSFTAISNWMMRDVAHLGRWEMVPNGVPTEFYRFSPNCSEDAPLTFLGRIEEIKGPHIAIEIARRTQRRLTIAGNIPDSSRKWAEENVLRHVDGERVCYIGPVDDAQKNILLGQSSAFLMPILWDEPFGIVMAEAMACGTPVIGMNRGAVPEVVEHGVTGFVCDDVDQMISAVLNVSKISRSNCRLRAEREYSEKAVVEGYLQVYRSRIGMDRGTR